VNSPESLSFYQRYELWILPLILLACIYFWNAAALTPLKILVVFFHEASHALATVLTGGQVQSMEITANQGGRVLSLGGMPFVIISAGYLGSLLWGAIILLLAAHSRADHWIMGALGALMLLLCAFYVRNLYGLGFGVAGGVLALAIAFFCPAAVNDLVLKCIGATTMLYVPMDIYSDTIDRSHLQSDARILAEYFGGSTVIWGGLWMIISVLTICATLYGSWRKTSAPSAGSSIKSAARAE
jgi:Peptidase M50B-like